MKKQLSFILLTVSIFSINVLPGQAAVRVISSNTQSNVLEDKQDKYALINGDKWCAELPWMGLLCWGL